MLPRASAAFRVRRGIARTGPAIAGRVLRFTPGGQRGRRMIDHVASFERARRTHIVVPASASPRVTIAGPIRAGRSRP